MHLRSCCSIRYAKMHRPIVKNGMLMSPIGHDSDGVDAIRCGEYENSTRFLACIRWIGLKILDPPAIRSR